MPDLHKRIANHVLLRFLLYLALSTFFLTAGAIFFLGHVHTEPASATYTHGSLSITIPCQSALNSPGTLTSEILDPEDHVRVRYRFEYSEDKQPRTLHRASQPSRPVEGQFRLPGDLTGKFDLHSIADTPSAQLSTRNR